MDIYADKDFYQEKYLNGRKAKIPEEEFGYWAMLASQEIKTRTYGNIDLDNMPEEVQLCCCEVAEKLYSFEAAKDPSNGMVLISYDNDGDKGTYSASEMSEEAVKRETVKIIRKWLVNTGLMCCGVV